jgi:Fe-S-cluster-containing hydrogenase component 2
MVKLRVHSEKCTGCKACEAACSYHHGKIFSPKVASLWVYRADKEGTMHIKLYAELTEEEKKGRFPCDRCVGEPEPLCAKYCVVGAIVVA